MIIVNYNGWPDVLRLVSALEDEPEFSSGELQIVVVDNASQGPDPRKTRGLPSCGPPVRGPARTTAVSPSASTPAGAWPRAPGCWC